MALDVHVVQGAPLASRQAHIGFGIGIDNLLLICQLLSRIRRAVPSAAANKGSYYEIIRKGLIGRGNVVDRRFANVLCASGSGFVRGELAGTISTVLCSLATDGVLCKAG